MSTWLTLVHYNMQTKFTLIVYAASKRTYMACTYFRVRDFSVFQYMASIRAYPNPKCSNTRAT